MQKLSGSGYITRLALPGILVLALFACKKSSSTESKTIFSDDFARANSTSLGSNWTSYLPSGTSFQISSAQAKPESPGATAETGLAAALYVNKVTGSFKVSAKFSITGGNYDTMGYLIGRSVSGDLPTNSYLCGYYWDTTTASPNQKYYLSLRKVSSSVVTSFGDAQIHTLSSGKADTITFTFDGTTLKCEIAGNSTIAITVADGSFSDGYVGMMGGGRTSPYLFFDNFLVEKL